MSFAGVAYNLGRPWAGRLVDIFTVDNTVYVVSGKFVVTHEAKHPASREPRALKDRRREASNTSLRA